MNKKQVVASLNEIANELDSNGLYKEANEITNVMIKVSQTGYKDLPIPEQRSQIDVVLGRARALSNQSSQFQTPGPGEPKTESRGWDYIKGLKNSFDPQVYKELLNEWNIIAEDIAGRKEPKKPYTYKDPTGDDALNYYVNQAMAQHNVNKSGWTTLKNLIMNDNDIKDKKGAYLEASKKFQTAIDTLGSSKKNFPEDSGLRTNIKTPDNRLPYPSKTRNPGENFSGPKSSMK